MKHSSKFLFIALIVFISRENFALVNPAYLLTASNFSFNCGEYTSWEFDIYMRHTNPSTSTFEYAGGEYFLAFNPEIANGGLLEYSIVSSDLPPALRPRNPSIGPGSSPSETLMRLALNPFPGAGNGFNMTNNGYPGTKIVTMRLTTSSTSFYGNDLTLNLHWRNPPIVTLSTNIFAYVGGNLTNITTPGEHFIDEQYCGTHFIFEVFPWECCSARLLSVNSAIEGLYNPVSGLLNRKDTVTVVFRDLNFPYPVVDSFKCRLDSINLSSFHIVDNGTSLFEEYYVVIKHHNSIETWSKVGIDMLRDGFINNYNFINSDTAAYGNNTKLVGTKYCLYSGDVNQDGFIDASDLALIDNDSYNSVTGYVNTDLNGNFIVDGTDALIAENNAVNFVQVVTPLN